MAIPRYFSIATTSLDKWKVVDVGCLCHILYSLLIRESFEWFVNDFAQVHVYIGDNMAVYNHRIVI
jgi:hypothetical protein